MAFQPMMAGQSGYKAPTNFADTMGKVNAANSIGRMFSSMGGSAVQPVEVSNGGMQRRMSQIQDSPIMKINESLNALNKIPDQKMREDLAYPLMKAEYMARQKRGI